MAYAYLRSDPGRDLGFRHGGDGARKARDQCRRCRAYQGGRTPLAWRQGRYDDGAYNDHTRRQSSNARIDCRAADDPRSNALANTLSGQSGNPLANGFQLADGCLRQSAELIEQRLRLFQIGRVEALGEPAVERCEKIAGFGVKALVAAEPGEARGCAQFPELGLLLLGDAQGYAIEFLCGIGMPLPQMGLPSRA